MSDAHDDTGPRDAAPRRTLNRMERSQVQVAFTAICIARGPAFTASILRPFGNPMRVTLSDVPDSALLAVCNLWGGAVNPPPGIHPV
jgi:hypothetical protein